MISRRSLPLGAWGRLAFGVLCVGFGLWLAVRGVQGFNGPDPAPHPPTTVQFGLRTDWNPSETYRKNEEAIERMLNTQIRMTMNYTATGASFTIGMPAALRGEEWAVRISSSEKLPMPLKVSLPEDQSAKTHPCVNNSNCVVVRGTVSNHYVLGGSESTCNGYGVPFAYTDFSNQAQGQQTSLAQIVRFDVDGLGPASRDQDWSRELVSLPVAPIQGISFDARDAGAPAGTTLLNFETPPVAVCEQYTVPTDFDVTDLVPNPSFRSDTIAYWTLDGTPQQPPTFSERPRYAMSWTNLYVILSGLFFSIGLALLPASAGYLSRRTSAWSGPALRPVSETPMAARPGKGIGPRPPQRRRPRSAPKYPRARP